MKIEIKGKFTEGYYNEMEADYPVFINNESLSNLVKVELHKKDMSTNFCDNEECFPGNKTLKDNMLIGKRVILTLQIDEA